LIENASGSGDITKIAPFGYFIGAALMIAGGIVEAIFGVKAERQALEHIATPLTVEDAGETEARQAAGPKLPASAWIRRQLHLRQTAQVFGQSQRRERGPHGRPVRL
jgi:CubicO group peptidase (beta-lactamase class C family)